MTPSSPATARPTRERGADGQVIGALLVLLGVAWLLDRSEVVQLSAETMISTLLVVLGVGLVITARRPGGKGLLLLGGFLSLALAATSSIDVGILRSGFGSRAIDASTLEEARVVSSLGVGELAVDLSDLDVDSLPSRENHLRYRLGVGDLKLRLPADDTIGIQVDTAARMGHLVVLGSERNGSNVRLPYENGASAERVLIVDLDVGIGKVTVERAQR